MKFHIVAFHRTAPRDPRRRRLVVSLGVAVTAVGAVAALVAMRPAAEADDTSARTVAAIDTSGAPVPLPPSPAGPALLPAVAPDTTPAGPAARTTTTTPTSTTTSRAPAAAAATDRVLALVNAERADAGCGALEPSTTLTRAAADYAAVLARAGTLSHTVDGTTFVERDRAAGYADPAGENIAQGQDSAQAVVTAWMNSPPHRRNILDCSFRTLGVGHASDGDYWVQEFGR